MKSFTLDYLGRYYFYEEDEFLKQEEEGEYILDNLKKSNRFDYSGATYTFTRFGNISKGETEKNVILEIDDEDINVKLNDKVTHLDLIYKMDITKLEDHYRIATRISEKDGKNLSVLLYIKIKDGEECIEQLKKVQDLQKKLFDCEKKSNMEII